MCASARECAAESHGLRVEVQESVRVRSMTEKMELKKAVHRGSVTSV